MASREVPLLEAATTLEVGQTISCYYPDSGSGNPCPRKGVIPPPVEGRPHPIQPDQVTILTSRGPRSLKYARMQGTLKIHD